MNLDRGDTVAIVAPAAQLPARSRALLPRAVDLLESWGLRVRVAVDPGHWFYLAGPDDERARHLGAALADPDVRAVFCTRGGYGTTRLLRRLTGPVTAKIVVGCSDITALHAYLAVRHPVAASVHGPNVATHQLLDDTPEASANRRSLHAVLFDPGYRLSEPVEPLCAGTASGPLAGGCLTLLASLLGTPFMPDLSGRLVFLEDVGEVPYRIDRLLTQLVDAGALDGVAGLVFGRMHECVDAYNDIRAVITDVVGPLGVPVGFGVGSGHGPVNLSLPLGAPARLDASSGVFAVSAGPVATG
ncbi:LD-carboxypeptidase [Dactylosporangium vinaceum]|uniref:LD-carboxypeptidase n=1 Tax=Dactylosporangium vinaceum TaxID=53362 RepID=A0ABV5MP45_9ACTN|nr:LD-carboxypeptidase [Dactylosporangium vinaceum]UAB94493.1 LD-carboxypeptidase [Dactylosporangium vinaceum]